MTSHNQQPYTGSALVIAATLFGTAVALAPSISFSFDSAPKLLVVAVGAIALILLSGRASLDVFSKDRTTAQVLCFATVSIVWIFVCVACSGDPQLAVIGTRWRYAGALSLVLVIFVGVSAAALWRHEPSLIVITLRSSGLASLCCGAYALAQVAGVDPILDNRLYIHPISGVLRPASTFGHAGYASAFAVVAFWLALGASRIDPKAWSLHYAGAAAALALIIVSGTRAAMLALCFGSALFVYKIGWRRLMRRPRLFVGASTCLVVSAGLYAFTPQFQLRFGEWLRDPGSARQLMWRDTLRLIADNPEAGVGFDNFAPAFARYESADLAVRYPNFIQESPHNVYLDAATSAGLPGLALLLIVYIMAATWSAAAVRRGDPFAPYLLSALASSAIVHVFFVYTIPNLLMLAIVCAAVYSRVPRQPTQSSTAGFPKPVIASVCALTATACFAAAVVVPVMKADYTASRIRQHLVAGDLRTSMNLYTAVSDSTASRFFPHFWYSHSLTSMAMHADAQARRSLADSAWQAGIAAAAFPGEDFVLIAYSLATVSTIREDWPRAQSLANQAARFAPNWYKPHWLMAQLQLRQGHTYEARRCAEKALLLVGESGTQDRQDILRFLAKNL